MSKETNVLTVEEILKRKDFYKNRHKELHSLYLERLDTVVKYHIPDRAISMTSMGMGDDSADPFIITQCLVEPNLQDENLLDEFGCKDTPLDIVEMLFTPGEIYFIAVSILSSAGYNDKNTVIDDLKK